MRNNRNLSSIAAAFRMDDREVAECAGVSKSLANSWRRSPTATKAGSGYNTAKSLSRYREMTDRQFDAFCAGLYDWANSEEDGIS